MRRSASIHLALMTTATMAAWTGCGRSRPEADAQPITAENTYTNNQYTPGVGYYHAPFRTWFPVPYNHFDPSRGYFRGGQWGPAAEAPPVAASKPDPVSAQAAEAQRRANAPAGTPRRSGFGSSSRPVWS